MFVDNVVRGAILLSIFCIYLLMSGCGGRSPSVAYYSLASIEQMNQGAEPLSKHDVSLGIGPISVPNYLKRPQITTRVGENRYQFNEFNRWAGIIEQDIVRVLGNNLGFLLGTEKIAFFPWQQHFKPDYRFTVDIIQFEGDLAGEAVLSARWTISDASGENILASGKNTYWQGVKNQDFDALVDAESQALAAFSRELVEEFNKLALMQ